MLGCKPNPVNLVGGVVVRVGGATPLMWVVVVTATVGGITSLVGIAKSGPFAAVAETTNNNTRPIAYICNRCLTIFCFFQVLVFKLSCKFIDKLNCFLALLSGQPFFWRLDYVYTTQFSVG